jgi:hypothetical protein
MIYETLEPFGPQAVNLNAGLVASIIANVNRGKDSKVFEAKEFALGDFYEEPVVMSQEEINEAVKLIAVSFGAKKKVDKKPKIERKKK